MPSIRPSRAWSRSRTASVTSGARKNAVMNLAEPSGSSPPEKPPGDHDDLALADAPRQLVRALGNRLGREVVDDKDVRHGAGALEGVRGVVLAVGAREDRMMTRGRATWTCGVGRETPALATSNETASTFSPSARTGRRPRARPPRRPAGRRGRCARCRRRARRRRSWCRRATP